MNFLILINNAPQMAPYHYHLGQGLKSEGHKVHYAISDDYFRYNYKNIPFEKSQVHVFSEYFKSNFDNQIIKNKYKTINVWDAFFSDYDRNIVNIGLKPKENEYYESLFSNLINFFDSILEEHSIDYIVYENISNSFAYFAFIIGQINKINFLGYLPSRLPERFEIQTEIFNIVNQFSNEFDKTNFDKEKVDTKEWVVQYLKKYTDEIPSYHSQIHPLSYKYPLLKLYANKAKQMMLISSLKFLYFNKTLLKYSYQLGNPLIIYRKLFLRQIKRRFKNYLIKNLFDKIDYNEQYFIFPIQFKPESSTSVWAKNYTDDLSVILNISSNLPKGTILYVKEHFVNMGIPSFQFYKNLKKIPNIKLIHPDEKNTPLIKKSKGIIALTSTMGFEALMMGKQVAVLGNIFYQKHPNCVKINKFEELHSVLLNFLNSHDIDPLSQINKNFIAAYYNITFPGNTDFVSYMNIDFQRFSIPLIKAIKIKLNAKQISKE